ncbi:MAG: excinuclease ABC subunit UvrA [Bryobacter sp.]|nr:excinuclease ABC subunit UvrA [Bryobacter sp.]
MRIRKEKAKTTPTGLASIEIRGARVHNLKNISTSIPHHILTVVTGPSGSGKSSLVFDTVYAEGQRRYVESLSAYARQFLERMEKPDVDEILGLAPPVAIKQKNTTRNPRSTVATATEIYDYLRVLFARAGQTWCPVCQHVVERESVDQVAQAMLAEPSGSRWYVLFPLDASLGTEALRDRLFDLRSRGFSRLYQGGKVFEFSTPESLLELDFKKSTFLLVDRLSLQPDIRARLVDAIELCYRESGEVLFEQAGTESPRVLRFQEKFACKTCGKEFRDPEPSLFSFNNPQGACPLCQGFGRTMDLDPDKLIPNAGLTLDEGAIDPWTKPVYEWFYQDFAKKHAKRVRLNVPYADLDAEERAFVLAQIRKFFDDVVKPKMYKVHVRVFAARYRGYATCPDCQGSRLREEARNVRLGGKTIGEVTCLNIREAMHFLDGMQLSPEQSAIAGKVLVEVQQRLHFLNDVGLDYLTLDRLTMTLSGGEAQRIQLATCLGSRLVGACYVLDEPSIGLHARDTHRLIKILHNLRDLGNTILVVEHDQEVMESADHIIDLGPGAGERGGEVIYTGTYKDLFKPKKAGASLTGAYLRGEKTVAPERKRRRVKADRVITFRGARANNIQGLDVSIPLDMLVAVTGVSGSGKSTLVHEVIHKTLERRLAGPGTAKSASADSEDAVRESPRQTCRSVEQGHLVNQVVLVDQSPIGRTPRSNPITYIKAFDLVRDLFASVPEAQARGYQGGHFSFNIPGGRCETCQGDGTVTVEMQFLADVELICDDCKGTRYRPQILEIKYKGKNIHDVLRMTVEEALTFFQDVPRLAQKLAVLADVGLGYLRLGQSATTLSGGEAQRVKLASHLGQNATANALFIFDEPTTGLHFDDIRKLLESFQRLIENGGSILLIEHNLDVIRAADWVIDLGPEGGSGGGQLVAQGTPEEVAKVKASYTGQYL